MKNHPVGGGIIQSRAIPAFQLVNGASDEEDCEESAARGHGAQSGVVRAVAFRKPEGPEVIEVIDRPVREAGPGEVRIRVSAAAVNAADINLRRGIAVGLIDPPWTPGMDAAGTIESVGQSAEHLAVGDPVMAALSAVRPEGGARRRS
jgi:Alcohol dehydrogenase GroES-like domain